MVDGNYEPDPLNLRSRRTPILTRTTKMEKGLAFRVILCASGIVLFFVLQSVEGRSEADDCTSGFMSRDRMSTVLDNYVVAAPNDRQAIVPEINFTCDGSIQSWIFGAQWRGMEDAFSDLELQIWRSSEDGSYTKVGSTTIITGEDTTRLYQYPLDYPLPFLAGDILGFYQPDSSGSQLRLQLAVRVEPLQRVYFRNDNPDSQFLIDDNSDTSSRNVLVSIETNSPGCANGFMNMETMRTLLGLEEVGRLVGSARRQQITPDIRFKCDGMITKWIIGALWGNGLDDTLFPELQLWRNIGNDVYQKINGTFITVQTWSSNLIYEYDDFSPIPFQAGDILGAFIPRGGLSKLRLRSEGAHGPLNYYLRTTISAEESPYDAIDLHDLHESLSTGIYHPLITVEIIMSTTSLQGMPSTTSSAALLPSKATTTEDSTSLQFLSRPTHTRSLMTSGFVASRTSSTVSEFQDSSVHQILSSSYLKSSTSVISQPTSSMSPTPPGSSDVSTDSGSQPSITSVVPPPCDMNGTDLGSFLVQTSITSLVPPPRDMNGTDLGSFLVQISITSVVPPPRDMNGNVSTDSGSQSSVGVGVGGGVGAAVVVLLVVTVLGVGLFVVWRRRNTSKLVLQPSAPANGGVGQLDNTSHILGTRLLENPVYESETGARNGNTAVHFKSALQQNGVYVPPTEYDLVGPCPSHKETLEFDNPLYSDTGPVTFTESNLYESTDFGTSSSAREYTDVSTIVQRERLSKDGAEGNVYSTPENVCYLPSLHAMCITICVATYYCTSLHSLKHLSSPILPLLAIISIHV